MAVSVRHSVSLQPDHAGLFRKGILEIPNPTQELISVILSTQVVVGLEFSSIGIKFQTRLRAGSALRMRAE